MNGIVSQVKNLAGHRCALWRQNARSTDAAVEDDRRSDGETRYNKTCNLSDWRKKVKKTPMIETRLSGEDWLIPSLGVHAWN